MRFDLHVHTALYSSCSKTEPEKIAQGAQAKGLDGIVLTEHGQIWKDEEHAELQAAFPDLLILRGIEVTSAFGDDFLIYGSLDPTLFYQHMEAKELLEKAQAFGCAVVLAHPYRYRQEVDPEVFHQPLTAIECLSFNVRRYMEEKIGQLRRELDLPCFASSDAHDPEVVGLYSLTFFDSISSEKELAESLRKKQFRLFVDKERIEKFNSKLMRELPAVKERIAQGKTNREIRSEFPRFNFSMLATLRTGGEIELLLR
jgi:predicted metal-dependent phosphoesterase TrpH